MVDHRTCVQRGDTHLVIFKLTVVIYAFAIGRFFRKNKKKTSTDLQTFIGEHNAVNKLFKDWLMGRCFADEHANTGKC